MTEETVGDGAPIVNDQLVQAVIQLIQTVTALMERVGGLRGIPDNMLSRAIDVQREAKAGNDTWQQWKANGMPLIDLGGEERISTRQFIAWAETQPKVSGTTKPTSKARQKRKGK